MCIRGDDICMERCVSEPYSPYDYVRQTAPYPAYDVWGELTDEERDAVLSFQDLGRRQDSWSVEAPDPVHVNCSIVNSYLRFPGFAQEMSSADLRLCGELISLLDSAISKSVLPKGLNVIRGLADPRWISGFLEDDIYIESGYGSYSLSVDAAIRYAQVNSDGYMVFLARNLQSGDKALYLGEKEDEMLVGRGKEYLIDEIVSVQKGDLSPVCKSIVYILEEA